MDISTNKINQGSSRTLLIRGWWATVKFKHKWLQVLCGIAGARREFMYMYVSDGLELGIHAIKDTNLGLSSL